MKFYAGEQDSEGELRAELEGNGLGVGRLEREGRFLMRQEGVSAEGRESALERLIGEEAGGRSVWVSFDWARQIDLETALGLQERLTELVDAHRLVVKTAALEEAIDEWPSAALRRAQATHSGTISASEGGLLFSRASPMPTS